jgi:hypothetical protein
LARRHCAFAAFGHHEMAMLNQRVTAKSMPPKQAAEYGSSGADQCSDWT